MFIDGTFIVIDFNIRDWISISHEFIKKHCLPTPKYRRTQTHTHKEGKIKITDFANKYSANYFASAALGNLRIQARLILTRKMMPMKIKSVLLFFCSLL